MTLATVKFNVKLSFRFIGKNSRTNGYEMLVNKVMKLKNKKSQSIIFLLFCSILFFVATFVLGKPSVYSQETVSENSRINLKHFNHLFAPIKVGNRKMAVVNIYSEYPDYTFAIEPAEGFACVDDVARAIVMLSEYLKDQPDEVVLTKTRMLVEFVLHMQNDNGYFNNFIWPDLSINTLYKTSVAEMNWWSFRALWSLETAHRLFRSDAELTARIEKAIEKVVIRIREDIPVTDLKTEVVNSIEVATWLPSKYAADQAAVAIIALLPYYKRSADVQIAAIINALAQGIMTMQKGDAENYPYGMFLSWKNEWHAWGNSQAYALLLAGQQLARPAYIESALREVDNFYPFLMKSGFAESLVLERDGGHYFQARKAQFPQISYGVRPMVYAVSEAYRVTKNEKYTTQLAQLKSWFQGNNIAAETMYNQKSGRTFDAIKSATEINMNSGAESTIESILVLQR